MKQNLGYQYFKTKTESIKELYTSHTTTKN